MTSRPLDRDRYLATGYVPASRRAAILALWDLDATLGAAVAGIRDPALGEIKLAWWREALEGLDRGQKPAGPVLQAIAADVLPQGIRGADLARMIDGWTVLVSRSPLAGFELDVYAVERGGRLFLASASLLGAVPASPVATAGEVWALIDLARRATDPQEVEAAVRAARGRALLPSWPAPLRPLSMLAVLARRDAEPDRRRWERQGSWRRSMRMARHNATGT